MSEHEYDKSAKLVKRGEKKLTEIMALERWKRILVSLLENPWDAIDFAFVEIVTYSVGRRESTTTIGGMRCSLPLTKSDLSIQLVPSKRSS